MKLVVYNLDGFGYISPIIQLFYEKFEVIIRNLSKTEEFYEVHVPLIVSTELLKKSGVFEKYESEFLKVSEIDAVISATSEETFLSYIHSSELVSYKQFPIRLLHFQDAFRNIDGSKGYYKSKEFYGAVFSTLDTDTDSYLSSLQAFENICDRLWSTLGLGGKVQKFKGADKKSIEYMLACRDADMEITRSIAIEKDKMVKGVNAPKLTSIAMAHQFDFVINFDIKYVDIKGNQSVPIMGSFGIGIQRLLYTFLDNLQDDHGFTLPKALKLFDIMLIPAFIKDPEVKKYCYDLYNSLTANGISVFLDDRDYLNLKKKFELADFFDINWSIVISKKGLAEGKVKFRSNRDKHPLYEVTLEDAEKEIMGLYSSSV
jgi:prolyl-tRNA synthetase